MKIKNKQKPSERMCPHCKGSILIRNPTGKCDHLYYPESCTICFARESKKAKMLLKKRREKNEKEETEYCGVYR